MKRIGLLGGMSWESTLSYYRLLNQKTNQALGEMHSANISMVSVDFNPLEKLQREGNWDAIAKELSEEAKRIERSGADFLVVGTNTMHKVADEIQQAIDIPLLHIADATASKLKAEGLSKIGLLGTIFTMEQAFYKERLSTKFGIDVIVPESQDRQAVHNVIYKELCMGIQKDASKSLYIKVIDELASKGAQAVILGCTEISLLVQQKDTNVPLYDTTEIHCDAIIDAALT